MINPDDIEKGPLVGKTAHDDEYGRCRIVEQSRGHVTLEIPGSDVDGTECRYLVVPERALVPVGDDSTDF